LWETTTGPVVALPPQVTSLPHCPAGPSVGDVQSHLVLLIGAMQKWVQPGSMHQDDAGGPFLLHSLLGLEMEKGRRSCRVHKLLNRFLLELMVGLVLERERTWW
jgi:hypothetical protein